MVIKNIKKIKILSWALYDLANTIFATNIISLYFPIWVTIQHKASDKFYILPYYVSMLAAAIVLPFLGILSDTLKKHSLFLIIFTCGCVFSTALIGVFNILHAGIVLFIFANFFNQTAGNVFYPALLPEICEESKIARVSGFGVALGYIGTIIGVFTVQYFIKNSSYNAVFLPTAFLFLLFSLPCFIFVSEVKKEKIDIKFGYLLKQEFRKLIGTFKKIKSTKNALRFFLAILLAINGVNGVLLNIGVYGKKVVGFLDSELPIFISVSTVFAFLSSLAFGFIVERFGAKRTLSYVLGGWIIGLTMIALAAQKWMFWIIGPCIGILLAGTWVSSRPLIIKLAPDHRVGEFFGFAGLASISGSLISPLVWLCVITVFAPLGLIKYRVAVFVLAVMIGMSLFVLSGVPEKKLLD